MKKFREKAEVLVDQYEKQLASEGLKIKISKRYFETQVDERTGSVGAGHALVDAVDRAIDQKKEKEEYHYERNKYHCLILTILPADAALVRREYCKDFAFVLKKVERAHIGQEPKPIEYEERKVLSKIEKRIQKILKKSEKKTVKELCRDTWHDAFRYAVLPEYSYKNKILGKDRSVWELMAIAFAVLLAVIAIVSTVVIGKLF